MILVQRRRTDGRLSDFIFCPMHKHSTGQTTRTIANRAGSGVTRDVIDTVATLVRSQTPPRRIHAAYRMLYD